MDPVTPGATHGSSPVFQGAAQDAQILRDRLNDLFNLAPEGSVIADPERRAKLAKSAENVTELTAQLAILQATVPGRVGRLLGPLITGLEKEPGTGKVRPGVTTAGNFLPSPFGYLDPTSVGLPRNFYLPPGSTDFIPPAADRLGLGLPEQRAEDVARNAALAASAATSRTRAAADVVSGESVGTLQDLAAGRGGLTRAGVLIATSGVDLAAIQGAAQAELDRLSNPGTGNLTAGLPAGAAGPLGVAREIVGAQVAQFEGAASAQDPARIPPVNDAGKRHERAAQGIARELIHERADP